jgi:23S rRNA pseudouridine2605 synthase
MAHSGIASRRACEKLIVDGRVSVNGAIVRELGTKVAPGDTVLFDGKPAHPEQSLHYLALNKPPLYICAASDPQGRTLVKSLLPQGMRERLYNVGRLDYLSSGLILMTNDGSFAAKVTRPASLIEKEYVVEAAGHIPDEALDAFRAGIEIDGSFYRCASARFSGRNTVNIVLIEGKNREIRRVFSHFHLHPKTLRRVRIGPVLLAGLPEGQTRPLTPAEIRGLGSGSV